MKISPINLNLNKLSFKHSSEREGFGKTKTHHYHESMPVIISPQRQKQLEDFAQKYGLKFRDISLLNQAFVYNSSWANKIIPHADTYQKLECIGDSVLNLSIIKMLSRSNKYFQEGSLSYARSKIASNENIAKYAQKLGLDKMSYLNVNEDDPKRLADMFEALLGAIFLDDEKEGFNNAYKFLKENFESEILSYNEIFGSYEEKLTIFLNENGYDPSLLKYRYYCANKSPKAQEQEKSECIVEYGEKIIVDLESESANKIVQKAFEKAYNRVIEEGAGFLDNPQYDFFYLL